MQSTRRLFHMAIAVAAFCFGSFAYAATDPVEYGHVLSFVLADVGAIGMQLLHHFRRLGGCCGQRGNGCCLAHACKDEVRVVG